MGRNKNEFGEDSYSLESDDGLPYSQSSSSLGASAVGGAKGVRGDDGRDENGTMSSESSDDDDDVLTFTLSILENEFNLEGIHVEYRE